MIDNIFIKRELILILFFLVIIFLLFWSSILYSRMRERDLNRQKNLAAIQSALNVFKSKYGFYPPSTDGNILACASDGSDFNLGLQIISALPNPFELFSREAQECEYGKDYLLSDLADVNTKIIETIPADPLFDRSYYYYSDGEVFAVFADMETSTVEDYDGKPEELGLDCGKGTCDYVKGNMTLDNLMQRYQNEVRP